jgi:membrane peptidoglycan carboxypeptidase
VSNPDLPEPYWQEARHDSQWRGGLSGPEREESPWDNDRFWRAPEREVRPDDGAPARNGRGRRGRDQAEQFQDAPRPARGARRAPGRDEGPRAESSWPDMLAGRSRRGGPQADDSEHDGRGGRFSQGADDLRNRLGMRGSAAGRNRDDRPGGGIRPDEQPDDAFWGDPERRRPARLTGGRDAETATGAFRSGPGGAAGRSRRAGPAGDTSAGYDGAGNGQGPGGRGRTRSDRGRRAAGPDGAGVAAGPGYNGQYQNGHDGFGTDGFDRPDGRTALRERPRDDWADGGNGRPGSRSAVTERPGARPGRRGGGGGGTGGGKGGGRGGDWDGAPRSRGERFKNWLLYGSWWRHWTWKKALAVAGAGIAAVILIAIIGIAVLYSMTPMPTDTSLTADWQYSSVYFSNGKLLGTFTNQDGINRELLTTGQIPTVMNQAMVAAEDRNFYTEGGISITGILRAGYEDEFGNGGLQGGSTITEQYAKNYYANIGASRTASTKIKEIFIAMKLAHSKSKPWILTQYLNTVPFGDNAYGVGAAAQAYFGINLTKAGSTLTVAQAAMLAAMPNQPSYFTPSSTAGGGYTALVQRWQYVLTNMARDNAITTAQADALCANCGQAQADAAFNKNVKISTANNSNGWSGYNGYLMRMVQQELTSPPYNYSQTYLDTKGLRITTTFNNSMIKTLAASVNDEKQQMKADGVPLPSYDHFGAAVIQPGTGDIVAIYGGPGYLSNSKYCTKIFCQYNMAEAPNPVGSSMKPYVLATAVAQGMDVQDSVLDGYTPLWIPPDWTAADRAELSQQKNPFPTTNEATSNGWWQSTSEGNGGGPLSVQDAAAQSSDPAFADLTHKVGVQNIIDMAQSFGVGADPFNLSGLNDLNVLQKTYGNGGGQAGSVQITFGGVGLTPIEQASTFATLADDGVYFKPHVVTGLYTAQNPQANLAVRPATHRVLSAAQAADEDYALSADNVNGTAYPSAAWPGRTVIGKTGTIGNGDNASEAWFLGAIPQYSMAIGLWTNSQSENLDNLPYNGTGGSYGGAWPAATWQKFMTTEFGNLPAEQFAPQNYLGFTKWIQVVPHVKKHVKPVCKAGQFQNCTCPTGQQCTNPNPTPSCGQPFQQPCGGTSPSPNPSPSCGQQFQQPCGGPSPSPSPSASCFGHPCNQGQTTATVSRPPADSSATLLAAVVPAEEQLPGSVITDRIRAYAASRAG